MAGSEFTSSSIGLTSTIPVEILFAAGLEPVDLNNLFIRSVRPEQLLIQAESAGFPHNICAWIKGIYSVVMNHGITKVIAVTGGDCSNTIALAEILSRKGVQVIRFDFPSNRGRYELTTQMQRLCRTFSVRWKDVEMSKKRLDRIRKKLGKLDTLTFQDNVVTGEENHRFLVGSSDFGSDPDKYEMELDVFFDELKKRQPRKNEIRLGFLGVPPIFGNLYGYIEAFGGRVVYNEVQRQFSMPFETTDIVEQYLRYTYPYGIEGRIADISQAIQERSLDGLIHYTQTFCFRQLYDIILRDVLPIPILTLEGDRPGSLDNRTAIRLETFLEMLKQKKGDFF
ncbi:MAG: 2-hydroxyacyl-CoA dehydratase [Deltaproteobacteria bacterium]|nr:2-hydroxyacyl-CoA dehydratase [Deltaproteobacteria bacterium]